MAIENVVKLVQAAQENPELALKLETVTSAEQVVEIGAGEGLEFTTEEAVIFRQKLIEMTQKAEDGELTEEELESAAGGVGAGYSASSHMMQIQQEYNAKDPFYAKEMKAINTHIAFIQGGGYDWLSKVDWSKQKPF
ncbi:Nif11-like leader peptide family natural product precursor [Microcoleus sp. T2B6]|uniref:Nif11-like leader peptide family natural product precursor n=1 Tax=Microcoleus sp. T2B6 TaxID=3055424 RepID=UPI002FD3E020